MRQNWSIERVVGKYFWTIRSLGIRRSLRSCTGGTRELFGMGCEVLQYFCVRGAVRVVLLTNQKYCRTSRPHKLLVGKMKSHRVVACHFVEERNLCLLLLCCLLGYLLSCLFLCCHNIGSLEAYKIMLRPQSIND